MSSEVTGEGPDAPTITTEAVEAKETASTRTSIQLPDSSYRLLCWRVSDSAAVQAGETVAFAIPKAEDEAKLAAQEKPIISVASGFKRPTRRRKAGLPPSTTNTKDSEASTSASAKPEHDVKAASQPSKAAPVSKPEADGRVPIIALSSGIVCIEKHTQDATSLNVGWVKPCDHPTFVDGMCVVCGALKTDLSSDGNNTNDKAKGVAQVTVAGQTVSVSKEEGERMARVDVERLQKAKKLALVLDLDHTLVHATHDPRAKSFLESRNDVRTLVLPVVDSKGIPQKNAEGRVVWMQHFVKLRPNVGEFLEEARKSYEIGVYTAGTRHYAEQICILLARHMVRSALDEPQLAKLRFKVERMEKELLKSDSLVATVTEETPPQQAGEKRKRVGFGISEEKSDAATTETLNNLKAELKAAEESEAKAMSLRKELFGTRIVSRTDVGDLGHDVKSLKRIFPCGGTMAVVMDDREDVWANAGDISSVRKGEPPENLLLVKPYHWKCFVGFADVNNKSGVDLTGGADGDTDGDSDRQLTWSSSILQRIHERYYNSSSGSDDIKLPIPELLKKMRSETLSGAHLVLSGLIPLHRQDKQENQKPRPLVLRYTESLGANISSQVGPSLTHVVAARDGTDKILAAKRIPGCFVVKLSWLMESYWSLTRAEERNHLLVAAAPAETTSDDDSEDDDFAAQFESELMG